MKLVGKPDQEFLDKISSDSVSTGDVLFLFVLKKIFGNFNMSYNVHCRKKTPLHGSINFVILLKYHYSFFILFGSVCVTFN